jgi:1-acyl-sn-glycerol-3-phosphate acyltransferase
VPGAAPEAAPPGAALAAPRRPPLLAPPRVDTRGASAYTAPPETLLEPPRSLRTMPSPRGFLCLLLLPLHTAVLGTLAIAATLVAPRRDPTLALGRLWSRWILATAGVKVSPQGAERSAAGPHVVICNHQSLFDIPALVVTLQGRFRIVAKRELFWIPVFGWALRVAGFISVDRRDRDKAIASLERGAGTVREGGSLVMFAEGTRSGDGRLRPLKKGAFHLAQQSGAAILPVTVSGSRYVLSRQSWIPRPGTIDVVVGEPLAPRGAGEAPEAMIARATAALEAGFTPRHRLDLEAAPPRRAARRSA